MAKTLLAVDDSTTMRKVLEITFSGEDFRVVTADTTQGAIGKMAENPQVCVIDTVLGGEDGYSLAKEVRKRAPSASIIMLASRYAPYDQAKGKDAGADDWADKPFDTQQLIDKVRKVMLAKEAGGGATTSPNVPSPATISAATPAAAKPQQAPPPPALSRGTQPSLSSAVPKGITLPSESPAASPAPPAVAAKPPVAAPPAPMAPPAPFAAPAAAAAPPAVTAAVNGALAGKLGDLGLTPAQADAVLALSREVVERIVWEVVPQLAEAIIKEEITRLTKE